MRRLRNGLAMAGCAALVCPEAARTEAALRRAAGTDRALKPADVDARRRPVTGGRVQRFCNAALPISHFLSYFFVFYTSRLSGNAYLCGN